MGNSLLPVAWVPSRFEHLAVEADDLGEGARGDRVWVGESNGLVDVLPDVLRHDGLQRELAEAGHEGLAELDPDCERVFDYHCAHEAAQSVQVQLGSLRHKADRERDIVRHE